MTHDPTVIKAHQFDPDSRYVQTPDGQGGTLYTWRGVCSGSADGYCQQMFFFIGTRFIGTDTGAPSQQIVRYAAAGTGAIAVTYANYRSGDPQCCPSGPSVTVTYRWNGSRLVASGSAPK